LHGTSHQLNNANFISIPYCETYWGFSSIILFFFCYSSKMHVEFFKLANFMKEKGNNILWNVKTHEINMFSLTKWVMFMQRS
jgi:hypothetical protein